MSSEEIRNLKRKLRKARANNDLQVISDCCCDLAAYLADEEEHEEALKLYEESLTCCEKLGNKVGAALAHRMLAEESINLGLFEEALKYVAKFLKYAEDEGNKVEEQRGYVLKGHVFFTQAEYIMGMNSRQTKKVEELLEQSMEAYRRSFAICSSELNDIGEKERLQMKARLLQNKSLVLSRQNKLEHAQTHLVRAIKICTQEKLTDTEYICYMSLGELYLKKNEPEKALNIYGRALDLSHSSQKKTDVLIAKAKTYVVMEKYKLAKTTLKQALKLKKDGEIKKLCKQVTSIIRLESTLCSTPDTEPKIRKELYKSLGDIFMALKSYKKSIKCYLNTLDCAQKAGVIENDLNKCYGLLRKALTYDKQYDKALFYSHLEVELLSKVAPEKAYKAYLRIAKLYELNGSEFEEIHFAYLKAKHKAQELKNNGLQIKCLKRLIKISKHFNKFDEVNETEKELQALKVTEDDYVSSCDSADDMDTDVSTDNESESEISSEGIIEEMSDSDVENEEYDRPKERCKRTKFSIKRNEKGETDLQVAVIKGKYKRVKQLLEMGHPVNVRDTAGWTPLHEACNHGYADLVNILLDYGANINDKGGTSCEGITPLHDAAINGQFEVIETLIKRGASNVILNDAGETPLECLMAWKRNTVLDSEEDAVFQRIVKLLKSPLDCDKNKRTLGRKRSLTDKKAFDNVSNKNSNFFRNAEGDEKAEDKNSAVQEYRKAIELLRGKRRTDRSGSMSDHSQNSDSSSSSGSRRKRNSAVMEYKKSIEKLRPRPKSSSTVIPKPKKLALISEDKYVENCIMDNDEEEEYESDDENDNIDDEEDPNGAGEPSGSEEDEIDSQPRKKLKSSSVHGSRTTRKSSFEREAESNPCSKSNHRNASQDSIRIESEDEDIFESVDMNLGVETSKQKTVQKTIHITVLVFNEKVEISVDQSDIDKLAINWLTQEILKKFSALNNPDTFVSFAIEGGHIGKADSLAVLDNRQIECVVTKWKTLPLSERYEKACMVTSHPDISVKPFGCIYTIHPQVLEIFRESSKNINLSLSNLKLSAVTLIPICKALRYQSYIQRLDLSKNFFGDLGMEVIVKIFEKCVVEELNVSGCNITSAGVYCLSSALDKIHEFSKGSLEVLDLSNNPVTDDAIPGIYNIVKQLTNLRTLKIDHCVLEATISVDDSPDLTIIQGNDFENSNGEGGFHQKYDNRNLNKRNNSLKSPKLLNKVEDFNNIVIMSGTAMRKSVDKQRKNHPAVKVTESDCFKESFLKLRAPFYKTHHKQVHSEERLMTKSCEILFECIRPYKDIRLAKKSPVLESKTIGSILKRNAIIYERKATRKIQVFTFSEETSPPSFLWNEREISLSSLPSNPAGFNMEKLNIQDRPNFLLPIEMGVDPSQQKTVSSEDFITKVFSGSAPM